MPSGPLVLFELKRLNGDQVELAYRERGTGKAATLRLYRRGALALARALEGTRHTQSREAAPLELVAEVRDG